MPDAAILILKPAACPTFYGLHCQNENCCA
jgi:hypothetical protein